ncbi:MAG: single-stranded-DNA-specific exonuclease RecJ [Candidatus Omnitrophica bacterium]|nr:single-stranded-DNA-specific exonuclease RecJ [Candidatus Omnitrophota bacterium]MCM8797998.1 single-stranded-DNA-specific exonuclease RecJ [Candidatus Omnitrophota bacterium]
MQKIWQILKPETDKVLRLTKSLGISSFLAQLLINRKIETPEEAEKFLNPSFSDLYDPFLFKDMGKSVERIKRAIERKEKILVYGDYDVDGITGMTILLKILKQLGGRVDYYIPHRLEEGYGISPEGVNFIKENRFNLVITVDCGTTDTAEIEILAKEGIDVVVTDHHELGETSPVSVYSLINPFAPQETYPEKSLSGSGVAFKLAQAILGNSSEIKEFLDLVCLGTIADISPLKGENRILVNYGLINLNESKKPGVRALMEVAEIGGKKISPYEISFILGPRINAMGRLDSAELSLKLFLTESLSEAMELAKLLDITNRRRQEIEEEIYNEAISRIEREINFKEDFSIVLESPHWHQGVIGIVASKLFQRYRRPVILFSLKDRLASGSGRVDLEDVHLLKILERCKHLFLTYGGHKSACGIKMEEDFLLPFKNLFNQLLKENFSPEVFLPLLYIDGELNFSSLSPALVEECNKLAPFGEDNAPPLFVTHRLKLKNLLRNRRRNREEVWVTDGFFTYQARGKDFEAWVSQLGREDYFDLVYTPRSGKLQGENYLSLEVKDFRQSI